MKEFKGTPVTIFHADHDVSEKHLAWALGKVLDEGKKGFFLSTLDLPSGYASLPCGLHGPLVGDEPIPDSEVEWVTRDDEIKIFTTYGGPIAPREVDDPSWDEMSEAERQESRDFWAEHALSR
jgi:hypothetical protein